MYFFDPKLFNMKKIYLFTILTAGLFANSSYAQISSDERKVDNSIEFSESKMDPQTLVLHTLINELGSSLEGMLVFESNELNLLISTFGATNKFTLSLKDADGKSVIDGNLDPNSSTTIKLSDYPSESFILRVSDMQSLKTSVFKISAID